MFPFSEVTSEVPLRSDNVYDKPQIHEAEIGEYIQNIFLRNVIVNVEERRYRWKI